MMKLSIMFGPRLFTLFVVICILYDAQLISSQACQDAIGSSMCSTLKKNGYCQSSSSEMKKNCAQSCSFCSSCKDDMTTSLCATLKSSGYCTNPAQIVLMVQQCRATCDFCGEENGATKKIETTKATPPPIPIDTPSIEDKNVVPPPLPTKETNVVNTCASGSKYLKRTVDIAVFISPKLRKNWMSKRKGNNYEEVIKQKLIVQLNNLYTPERLGNGIDIKFNPVRVQSLSSPEHEWIVNKMAQHQAEGLSSASGVAAFCSFLKLRERQAYWKGEEWDLAIYLVDGDVEGAELKGGAAGIVRAIGGVCQWNSLYNCGIINGRVSYEGLAFDRLVAHEVGHLLGFEHPSKGNCQDGIMTAPGKFESWSSCVKQQAYELFSNPSKYPCLASQCG